MSTLGTPVRVAAFLVGLGVVFAAALGVGNAVGPVADEPVAHDDEHVAHCVADAVRTGGPEADAKLKEASDAIARLVRS